MNRQQRRKVYTYDAATCTWQERKPGIGRTLVKLAALIPVAILAFGLAWHFYQKQYREFRQAALTQDQHSVYHRLEDLSTTLAVMEDRMDALFRKTQTLYMPILESDAIPEAQWAGGRGGSELFSQENTDLVRQLTVRIETLQYRASLLSRYLDEVRSASQKKSESLKGMPSLQPVTGQMMSGFGQRNHPIRHVVHLHTGLDFGCAIGTPVYATADGVVTLVENSGNGYGLNVDIDHKNGYVTKYAHLSQTLVQPGQRIRRGDRIALSGNTGLSSGPHLHYEVIRNGEKIDPLDFIYHDLTAAEYQALKRRDKTMD